MRETQQHPDATQLAAFVAGSLDEPTRQVVEAHIEQCAACCDQLQSLPHDELVIKLRRSVASPDCEETLAAIHRGSTESQTTAEHVPIELADHARYRIVKRLGTGGMGVVYQAEHRLMGRMVALKVLRHGLVASKKAAERFRLEVQAAATLSHRNIVAAYDAEQAGDLHFLVMEFIEGVDLSELVHHRGRLSVLHACNYTMQVAQGLQHAFEQGMVHRDMKPHNLMRTAKGTVKILDFGLAKFATQEGTATDESGLTELGVTLGTPDYIAPEQARDARQADIRADIYGLGCTLYFLLTGQPPFPKGTAIEKILAHCEHEPTPVDAIRDDVPEEVVDIVQRMMAKDPADRWQSPADVVNALKPFAKPGQPQIVSPAKSMKPSDVATSPPREPLEPGPDAELLQTPAEGKLSPLRSDGQHPNVGAGAFWSPLRVGLGVAGLMMALMIGLGVVLTGWSGNERQSAQGDWVDLLATTRPSSDVVAGIWRSQDDALVVQANDGSAQNARIAFRYAPPREYDFEVVFTRQTGDKSIALHFVCGAGRASFDIDAWEQHLIGIQNVNGNTLKQNALQVKRQRLMNGQAYTALLQVRRDGVSAFLNGVLVSQYDGDGADLSMLDLWTLPDPKTIGLGAYDCDATFHRVRVRPYEERR